MAVDLPELPHDLLAALLQFVQAVDRLQIRYALIGGVATAYRSRPRVTLDLDFLLEVPQLVLPGLLEDLRTRGFVFDTEVTIREWTSEHLTVLSFHGLRIDWLKPVLPCYRRILEAAQREVVLGCPVRIAASEGLILMKLLAFRSQDQVDIENLLAANRGQLDLEHIRREWATVAALDDPRLQRFDEMVARFYVSCT
jgi:hypothetical protein